MTIKDDETIDLEILSLTLSRRKDIRPHRVCPPETILFKVTDSATVAE